MKKKIRIILGLIIIISIIVVTTIKLNAAETITATETTTTSTGATVNWSYQLNDSGEIVNLKCTNKNEVTGNLTIPATIDEHSVIEIGGNAFKGCTADCLKIN